MQHKVSEKVRNNQVELFDRVIQNASQKVKAANDRVIARINDEERINPKDIEKIRQLGREFEERRKVNEREEDEEREIWYEILDNREMAEELGDIADSWFLEWALAVYKDEIQSDAIREAYTEYQMIGEWEIEAEIQK